MADLVRLASYPPVDGYDRNGVRGCSAWRVADRSGRIRLETCGSAWTSMVAGCSSYSMSTAPCGTGDAARLLAGARDGGWEAVERARASACVPALLRADSSRVDREPPQRCEERQSSGELGASDVVGAGSPCDQDAWSAPGLASGRRVEPSGEAHGCAGRGDPRSTCSRGTLDRDRRGLRRRDADRLEDRARRAAVAHSGASAAVPA